MTMIFQTQLQIAVGNNNTAGLVAWEGLVADSIYFYPIRSYGTYDTGDIKTRLTGVPYFAGVDTLAFITTALTIAQFYYLKTTYCAGGYSGLVTIKARLDNPSVYANLNATIILPKENDMEYRGAVYVGAVIRFIDLEVIP